MTDKDVIFAIINKRFSDVQSLGNGIFRGNCLYKEQIYAAVYFDLSDRVVERAKDLVSFQERLLGSDFFNSEDGHRWNNYLYLWAGSNSQQQDEFNIAKSDIEADRHYARKFVLTKAEFLSRFGNVPGQKLITYVNKDTSAQWEKLLLNASLGIILEQPERKKTLELIGSGKAFITNETSVTQPIIKSDNNQLGKGALRRLRVNKFRSAIDGKEFLFTDINLIFGQNGAGKTSLLESIEALYCGRIRSDNSVTSIEIDAELAMPDGSCFKTKSINTVSIIKARNFAWYGRSHPRAEDITNAFTQFNFLDTDAAFRLANITQADDIVEGLSPLLVGAGTSKLWKYLKKFNEAIDTQLKIVKNDASSLLKQTELLSQEIKRLKESPSNSTAIANTYRAGLRALGAKWCLGEENSAIASEDRYNLEFLSRGFNEAIEAAQDTSTTIVLLQKRKELFKDTLNRIRGYVTEREIIREEIFSRNTLIKKYKLEFQVLQDWALYCNAGAPVLYEDRKQKLLTVKKLHDTVGSIFPEDIINFSVEYESRSIQDALRLVSANLEIAVKQEHYDVKNLEQIEKLGESLSSLRSELRTIATSIIKHTKDSSHCPICMTIHNDNELLLKIEKINSSEAFIAAENLRQTVQTSKNHLQLEKNTLKSLKFLERFAATRSLPNTIIISELRKQILAERQDLFALKDELLVLNSDYELLDEMGIEWNRYSEIRDAASAVLGKKHDHFSKEQVNNALDLLTINMKEASQTLSQLDKKIINIDKKCSDTAKSVDILNSSSMEPKGLVLKIERTLITLEKSIEFLDIATQYIELQEDQHLEDIHLSLEQIILDFDKAKKAENYQLTADSELKEKIVVLEAAQSKMDDVFSCLDNFEKANNVLCTIINDHSIEEATRESFESIRIYVSDIFARIHAPAEYTLGNFSDGLSLGTIEGKEHSVNQVSTGQRAALALSIFLALNLSAENSPPIMLIDDPIAHIDDLNALSFIDYLRDLSINTNKQIFFATADAKLAALFEKKFEFLGKRYNKIVLPR